MLTLSGHVYVDGNNNNTFDANEVGLAGVLISLNGVDSGNHPLPTQVATTGTDGSYSFATVPFGTYSIREAQPSALNNGLTKAGTLGGTANSDTNSITGFQVAGVDGTGYDFNEQGVTLSAVSINLFLASTPSRGQLFNNAVSSGGTNGPWVTSMAKLSADPSSASSVSYKVTFNKPVGGVDASDFAAVVSGGITTGSITSVTGSGDTYTVTMNSVGNGSDGTLALRLVDNDSIFDQFGGLLGDTGADTGSFLGPAYTISHTASLSVTVDTVTDPVTSNNSSTASASGTAPAGSTISLVVTNGLATSATFSATTQPDGHWTVSNINVTNISDGTLTYTATALDSQNHTGAASKTGEKDTSSPITLDSFPSVVNLGNVTHVTVSGTSDADAHIEITIVSHGGGNHTVTADADGGGNWTKTFDLSTDAGLLDGDLDITAKATDPLGNVGQTDSDQTLHSVKDTVAPTVVITGATDSPITSANADQVTIEGTSTADDSTTVSLVVSDPANHQVTPAVAQVIGGTWGFGAGSIHTSTLDDGLLTFKVTITDDHGNVGTATVTRMKDAIAVGTIDTPTSPINIANASSASASGTVEDGATVSLVVSDGTHTTASLPATIVAGAWSVTGINLSTFNDGTANIQFTATIHDIVGNTATKTLTVSKDTIAPAVAVTTVTNPITIGNRSSASASGTVEAGSTVSLVVSDGTHTTAALPAVVTAGSWSVTGIDLSAFNDSSGSPNITFTATATDAAGNTKTSSATATKHTVTLDVVTDPINAATATNTSASGTGQEGAAISVVASDGTTTTTAQTTTVVSGVWSVSHIDVSGLNEGTITYTVTATVGAASATAMHTALKDTIVVAAITAPTNPINIANASNVTVSGTVEAGATVSLVVSDGIHTTASLPAVVTAGTWSVTGIDLSTFNDSSGSPNIIFTATITDAVGNTAPRTITLSKDTVAPDVALVTVTDPITIANVAHTTASGTGENGDTIVVTATDGTTTVTSAQTIVAGGTWSISNFDVSGLKDVTITYKVTATDPAFNTKTDTKTAAKSALHIDSVTDPITSANVTNASASGTGEEGATIDLVVKDSATTQHSSTTYHTTVSGGLWTITGIDLSGLTDGTVTFQVTATDGATHSVVNSLTALKDTVAEADFVAVTDPINKANFHTASASGTVEAGATLTLTVSDGPHSVGPIAATVSGTTWSVVGINLSALNDGNANITYTLNVTDARGNTSVKTHTGASKDILEPDVVFAPVDPINAAHAGNLTLSGTCDDDNATIQVTATDGTTTLSAPATTVVGGVWTITGFDISSLLDHEITFKVTATDHAGNATINTTTAIKDTVLALATLNAVTPINGTNSANASASGTVEADGTVTLVVTDGSHSTGPLTAVVTGTTWSVTGINLGTFNEGSANITFTATIADAAGNSTTKTSIVSKDTVLTTASLDPVNTQLNAANSGSVPVSGTVEAGGNVSVTVSDGVHTTTAVAAVVTGTTWSVAGIDVSGLDDGNTNITFTATISDAAGNTSVKTFLTSKDTLTTGTFGTITDPIHPAGFTSVAASGTVEAGSTVTVVASDGTHNSGPFTATVTGTTWSVSNINVSTLDNGTIHFLASFTDTFGNTATAENTATKSAT